MCQLREHNALCKIVRMRLQLQSLAIASFLLFACDPMVANRGHVERMEDVGIQVTVGDTTKAQILRLYGSPSSTSTFGQETWYYIAARKETTAFLRPEVVDQKVTQITFDENGVVSSVNDYDKGDEMPVAIVSKTTPTEGHSLGFMEQVLGNLGRFNTSKRQPGATRR